MTRSVLSVGVAFVSLTAAAHAAIPIIGGPTYDAATQTGYQAGASLFLLPGNQVAFDGFAQATLAKFTGSTGSGTVNTVPVRFASGTFTEYATPALPGTSSATTSTGIDATNAFGVSVGTQRRNDSTGRNPAQQALRWATPSQPMVLGNGITGTVVGSYASGINDLGTAVGTSLRFEPDANGNLYNTFSRPVRWAAGTSTATPLDLAATTGNTVGSNSGDTAGIDAAGTAYGAVYSFEQYAGGAGNFGFTAVRWNAGGTALTELAHAAAPANGSVEDRVTRVRRNGFLAGETITTTSTATTVTSTRAPTRWAPDGSVTVLQLPANAVAASSYNRALALNDSGTTVGHFATQRVGSDGLRPVRWDSGTAAPTLLGLIGTPTDTTSAWAIDVNNSGIAVGVQRATTFSTDGIAVLWGLDGVAVDLNTFIDPTSGWRLIEADSITDTGYVAGVGMFDPDGNGPVAAYGRSFLIQVPEPASLAMLGVAALLIGRRRRT